MADTEAQSESESSPQNEMSTPACLGVCLLILMGPLCILAGIAVLITAISTTHWVEYSKEGRLILEGGLWEQCLSLNNTCVEWDDDIYDTVYLKMTIAALIIATIGYFIGFFIMSCFVISIMSGDGVSLGGHSSWAAAVGINITGIGLFTKFKSQSMNFEHLTILPNLDYGWSFHLAWGAVVLVMGGCGLSLLVGLCSGDRSATVTQGGEAPENTGEASVAMFQPDTNATPTDPSPSMGFTYATTATKSDNKF